MPWTEERKRAWSKRLKELWADPKVKAKRTRSITKSVRKAMKDPVKRANLIAAVKRGGKTRTKLMSDRFWEKVDKNGPKQSHMKTRCWNWTGTKMSGRTSNRTYGLISREGKYGGHEVAHRYSYIINKGLILRGEQVQHRCDNPLCVRPSHLKLGTQQDNSDDMKKRDRPRGRYRTTTKP